MKFACFDIGNVLCHVDFSGVLEKLSKTLNISADEAMYFLNRVQKLHDMGLTSLNDELRDHFKIRSEYIVSDIIESWNKCIVPNNLILDKLLSMQNEVKFAILSNIGIEHKYNLSNILSPEHEKLLLHSSITHFSCDVGCRKPSLLYYQSFLQQYPEFKGCVYVDDLVENLQASQKFGFQTFHFNLNDYYSTQGQMRMGGVRGSLNTKLKELEKIILK